MKMLDKLWENKNNNTKKIARKEIEKARFVFERAKDFMKTEWRGLFYRSYSMIEKTYNPRKEGNEVGL